MHICKWIVVIVVMACYQELFETQHCKFVSILDLLNEIYYYVRGKILSVFQNNLCFFWNPFEVSKMSFLVLCLDFDMGRQS